MSTGSTILINGIPYTVASIPSDTALTLSQPYAGGSASGLSIPATLKIQINAVTTVSGTLTNPRAGDVLNGATVTAINGVAGYAMTKAALNMLTKRLAAELGEFGVTVNAVSPGMITTDLNDATHADPQFRATVDNPAATTLLRRNGQPEDIAGVVSFLAGPDASFITAQVLTVDGGRKDFLSRSG